jgi:ribonuclease-3
MDNVPVQTLIEILQKNPRDLGRIIDAFVTRFNAVYGNAGSMQWDITKEEWDRYAFLGDRVISLILAQALFSKNNPAMNKGEMTKMMGGIVSNEAFTGLLERYAEGSLDRLVPGSVPEQDRRGKGIAGSAFEAFIGALYCEMGPDDVVVFVNTVMEDVIRAAVFDANAIGALQEYLQQGGRPPPEYTLVRKDGSDHRPVYTYSVSPDGIHIFEGTGTTKREAKQRAALQALEFIRSR